MVWRGHSAKYHAFDYGGSLRRAGRYHRCTADGHDDGWPALYTALELAGAMVESAHARTAGGEPILPKGLRYTSIDVRLSMVLDLRDPGLIGLTIDDLSKERTLPQHVAFSARLLGVEAMLVPSAVIESGSGLSDAAPIRVNLVIFPDLLLPSSTLSVVESFALRMSR